MKYLHTTKNGTKIELEDLELSHLKNIINHIKNKIKGGYTVIYGYAGSNWEPYYDEDYLTYEEAKKHFNYKKYKNELKRREQNGK